MTTTNAKHTPGPWHKLPARTLINIKGPKGEQICQIPIRDKANAHLIAAAPELLEALQAIVMAPYGVALGDLEKAKIAITKATGGQ